MSRLTAYEAGEARPLRVVLCYHPADRRAVRLLYRRLRAAGLDVWFDEENLARGQGRRYETTKAVSGSDVVVICLSAGSLNQGGDVRAGMRFALDVADAQPAGTVLPIPLRLEECEVPERLRRWQPLDYFVDDGYLRLMRALLGRAEELHLGMDSRRGLLEPALERAISRREFLLHYHPVVALDGPGLLGFEALLRWQDPERGLLPAEEFVTVAEETGQILTIGRWALVEACRQMARWQEQFRPDPPLFVSVNLSERQISRPDIIAHVKEALAESGLSPHSLQLEATHGALVEGGDAAFWALATLGVGLCIDDFGTAYSTSGRLHRLPASTLKIERALVGGMVDDEDTAWGVRTLVMRGREMRLDVVAKGVETGAQAGMLKGMGCHFAQGHYFGKPAGAEVTKQLIDKSGQT